MTEAERGCKHGHFNCTRCYEELRLARAEARFSAASARAAELTEKWGVDITEMARQRNVWAERAENAEAELAALRRATNWQARLPPGVTVADVMADLAPRAGERKPACPICDGDHS